MEEEIHSAYSDAHITLIEGNKGIFEIWLKETLLFSKKEKIGTDAVRFPHVGESVSILQKTLG